MNITREKERIDFPENGIHCTDESTNNLNNYYSSREKILEKLSSYRKICKYHNLRNNYNQAEKKFEKQSTENKIDKDKLQQNEKLLNKNKERLFKKYKEMIKRALYLELDKKEKKLSKRYNNYQILSYVSPRQKISIDHLQAISGVPKIDESQNSGYKIGSDEIQNEKLSRKLSSKDRQEMKLKEVENRTYSDTDGESKGIDESEFEETEKEESSRNNVSSKTRQKDESYDPESETNSNKEEGVSDLPCFMLLIEIVVEFVCRSFILYMIAHYISEILNNLD